MCDKINSSDQLPPEENEKAADRKKPARRGLKSGTRLKVWRPETEPLHSTEPVYEYLHQKINTRSPPTAWKCWVAAMQQLALFESPRLPRKPYCSDDLANGLMIRPLRIAIQKRYIQPNPPGKTSYLSFDVDRPDAGAAWMDSNAPRPNFVIKNPENGHAHYLYALEHPVCTTSAARLKPMRYLAAIEASIAKELGADAGYSGLIIKNPCHGHWQTIIVEPNFYSMSALADHLDLTAAPANDERQAYGLGRNCSLFDTLRKWAYKSVSDYWKPNGEPAWSKAVRERAHAYNVFVEPLQSKEVDQISKSVSKWVWKHFSPTARQDLIERTHTPELQAKRGAKKGAARREEMFDHVMLLTLAAYSTREIAAELSIPQKTVARWIKQHRERVVEN